MPHCFSALENRQSAVAVVGLGYVGLPLAVALARHFDVIGLDISAARVDMLTRERHDITGEVADADLATCTAWFTTDPALLREASVIIVAVPTPIDSHRNPDLSPVEKASLMVGAHMARGAVVVYESTVYPGVTEEICVPLLERASGLRFPDEFTVGYSPERINPGDKVHTLESIMKIVSGSDEATRELLVQVYGSVVHAGIHRASSIRVAEAAKVIENTQRDINIALMNELSLIFDRMGIDTLDVLEAAGTKWNFLPFRPGLVGGHCIGVDPYYLTYKAEEYGYHPQVILAGRRINDAMGKVVAEVCVKKLITQGRLIAGARVGVLGLTFKENVPDLRNTRVIDIVHELESYGIRPVVHDPLVTSDLALEEYGLELAPLDDLNALDALIVAVPHELYRTMDLKALKARFANPDTALILDIKGCWSREALQALGYTVWRL